MNCCTVLLLYCSFQIYLVSFLQHFIEYSECECRFIEYSECECRFIEYSECRFIEYSECECRFIVLYSIMFTPSKPLP